MEKEKTSCIQRNTKPISFNSLRFIRCIFMTDEQYNKKQIYKPKQTLFIEKRIYVNNINDVDKNINEIIDEIHIKLKEVYKKEIRIPYPIFIMLGRELEIDTNLFENETFPPKPIPKSSKIKYGNTEIPLNNNNELAIIDYIKGFFNSGLSTKTDENKYKSSIINSYKFKGNIKIYLYVPYLTNTYKFISNLNDLVNSFYFFNTIMNSNFYLNISRTSTYDTEKLRKELKKNKMDERIINNIITGITSIDKIKYPLYDDLLNLCFDGGCVSDIGDDFNILVPQYTNDEDTDNKNATDKSPFMPNKCLSKTNGYLCNIRYASNNKDIHPFIKENAMKIIKENLTSYTEITNKIENKETLTKEENEKISKYSSPINLIISVINKFIKDNYSDNLNDDKKGDIKVNHYSKNYSENVIKELSYLKKMNGIPEFVLSLYEFKEELKKDKIAYMPFSKIYPTNKNVFNFGDIVKKDEIIYSFNLNYGLKLISNGFVFVFNIKTNEILYFLNREIINNPIEMSIQENGLLISFENKEGNIINMNYLYNLSSLVSDNDDSNPPFSLIINDDGLIRIYGNGFYDATNKELDEFINNEKTFINSYNMMINKRDNNEININPLNINNILSIKTNLNENILNNEKQKQETYLYCSSTSLGCKI